MKSKDWIFALIMQFTHSGEKDRMWLMNVWNQPWIILATLQKWTKSMTKHFKQVSFIVIILLHSLYSQGSKIQSRKVAFIQNGLIQISTCWLCIHQWNLNELGKCIAGHRNIALWISFILCCIPFGKWTALPNRIKVF